MAELIPARGEFFSGYNGTNILAAITIPGEPPYVFAELQTLSYSIHREKRPVRVLGTADAVAYTYGPRTIAGSLIFATLDKHMVMRAMEAAARRYRHLVADQLPPFHITVFMANEYGKRSRLTIYNCSIVDEGQVFSVEDLIIETTMSYVATGIDLLNIDEPREIPSQAHPQPTEEESEDYMIVTGQLLPSAPGVNPENVLVTIIGDGFRSEGYTDANGKYVIKAPRIVGPIKIYAYRDGYTVELNEQDVGYVQRARKQNLQSQDYQHYSLEEVGIDPYTVKVWVNGKLVSPDSEYAYVVDPLYGVIQFFRPLSPNDRVDAEFTYTNSAYFLPWNPPSRTFGVMATIEDGAGNPIANAQVVAYTEAHGPIATTTDNAGRLTISDVPSAIKMIRLRYDSSDWITLDVGPIERDSVDLGTIVVEASEQE